MKEKSVLLAPGMLVRSMVGNGLDLSSSMSFSMMLHESLFRSQLP